MSLAKTISDRLQAGALVVVVKDPDEALAAGAARLVAATRTPDIERGAGHPECLQALEALATGRGTLILKDFLAVYGHSNALIRAVREIALQERDGEPSRLILIEQPATPIPPTLIGDVEIVSCALPGLPELTAELDAFLESQEAGELPGNGEARYALAGAVAGLPRHEAARLFGRCWVDSGGLDVAWLRREKAQRVTERLGGALTFESTDCADVGGLDNLMGWLDSRRPAFGSARARNFGLPEPKGLLMLGAPGCGKSLVARTVGKRWELPLLRLDAGKLFGSLVGQSEQQTRQAIEAAEACAPCVLWIDELEKAFGSGGGSSGDSGTSQRVFGSMLTWLQEKTAPVFVVATANRVHDLPPELLRKGRFDELFFVGLPDVEERSAILGIHVERRGRQFSHENLEILATEAEGFSGAELEQAVIEGLFSAFAEDRELKVADVRTAIDQTAPLSRTMAEESKKRANWAEGRCRPASSTPEPSAAPKRPRARRRAAIQGPAK